MSIVLGGRSRRTGRSRRRITTTVALCASTALGAAERRANAELPTQVHLVWVRGERAEACADRAAIARHVIERLGRDVFSESAPRSIEGVVQHEGELWEAHLYVREGDGHLYGSRYFTSAAPDCAALDAAVTLAIALAIDPDAASRPPSPTPSITTLPAPTAPSPSAAPSVASSALPIAAPPAPSAARPLPPHPAGPSRTGGLSVTARALVVAKGLLPAVAAGGALSAEGPGDRTIQGTVGLLYFPEVLASDSAFGLTAAWLGACAQPWAERRVALAICGKVFFGAIHAVVYSVQPVHPGDRLWSGASASVGAKVRVVGPLLAELGGEALIPFARQVFSVTGRPSPAFQEGPVELMGFAGVGVSIP